MRARFHRPPLAKEGRTRRRTAGAARLVQRRKGKGSACRGPERVNLEDTACLSPPGQSPVVRGARQARADEICSHTPQPPRPANFGSKLLQSWHDTFTKTQSPCGEPPKRPHCAIDLNPNPGNSPDTPPGPSRQVALRGPALTGNRSTRKGPRETRRTLFSNLIL